VSVILQTHDTGHDEILRTLSVKSQIIDTEDIFNDGKKQFFINNKKLIKVFFSKTLLSAFEIGD